MEPVTADLRESGQNEGEKLLHVIILSPFPILSLEFVLLFLQQKKQPNATATCVILQMNLPQKNKEGFFNFEQVLKMTILKTKIAEC